MGEQMRWFYLDAMYNSMTMDKLLYRMPFQDNPAAAQRVPRREQYDTTLVKYDEIAFNLEKVVTSYDIPIEDTLRALIDPITPLSKNNKWSMAYFREREALAGLQQIGNYTTSPRATEPTSSTGPPR